MPEVAHQPGASSDLTYAMAGLPARIHVYNMEPLSACVAEILPLTQRHFEETSRFKRKGLTPDVGLYEKIEAAGNLRIFTVRTVGDKALIGYCLMVARRHHHSDQIRAVEDLLYIVPERRGIGQGFVSWIDAQLEQMGVEVVYRSVQVTHNHGKMFERIGYDKTEETWARSLTGGPNHG